MWMKQKASFIFKAERKNQGSQVQKTDKRQSSNKTARQSTTRNKVQIKNVKLKLRIYQQETGNRRSSGRTWREQEQKLTQTDAMNEQRRDGKQRLKTQTPTTRPGTGEEGGGRSPGEVTRGRSTEKKTLTDRRRQTAAREYTGGLKSKHKTQHKGIEIKYRKQEDTESWTITKRDSCASALHGTTGPSESGPGSTLIQSNIFVLIVRLQTHLFSDHNLKCLHFILCDFYSVQRYKENLITNINRITDSELRFQLRVSWSQYY